MRLLLLSTVALIPLVACDCNCGVKPLNRTVCAFTVEPSGNGHPIEFNATEVNHTATKSFVVTNTGTGVTLTQLTATLETTNGGNYAVDIPADTRLAPNENSTFVVSFTPLHAQHLASNFTLSHVDVGAARCPSVQVFLDGTGTEPQIVDAGTPDAGDDHDAGFLDAGPQVDAGSVETPDGGVILPPNAQWFAYGAFEDARARFVAVEAEDGTGDIIAIGGYGEDGIALDSIERFNPATGISRVVQHMAVPRAEPSAATLADGRIAIFGGRSDGVTGVAVRTVEVLDPTDGDTLTCADPQGCALADQGNAVLPAGRIGGFASAHGNDVVLVLGRGLDVSNNEVDLGGGDLVHLSGLLARDDLANADLLTPRHGTAQLVNANTGDFLVVGGETAGGVTGQIFLVDGTGASALTSLAFPRTLASLALLSTGDAIVAGGASATGAGELHMERLAHAFAGGPFAVQSVALQLPARVGGSLVALQNDFLLWAGGMASRTDTLTAGQSLLPQSTADVVVPLGADFVRLAADNELAQGRFEHQALAYSTTGGAVVDEALFLGGLNTSPRREPHPHIERFISGENRFLTYGLMGPGTAMADGVVQNSGAALVSAGGVDPHTGRTSSAVRAFDAVAGVYVEAGELSEPRRDHTLTRISDSPANALLVAGGRDENGVVLASLSLFDSVNRIDRQLPLTLRTARANATATRLADGNPIADGTVLICGGQGQGGEALDTCELVVPPSNPLDASTFATAQVLPVLGRMSTGRVGHTATIVDNGDVLLVGGRIDVNVPADLFTPDAAQSFLRATGQPNKARRAHASVFIGSGRVLVVGGDVDENVVGATASAELYVLASEVFLPLPDMIAERSAPAAILTADGNVIIAGGTRTDAIDPLVPTRSNTSSELYVVSGDGTGTFEALPNAPMSFGRSDIVFVDVLGRAIAAGGTHRDGIVTTGDERHTPITFVDFLQDPADAIAP